MCIVSARSPPGCRGSKNRTPRLGYVCSRSAQVRILISDLTILCLIYALRTASSLPGSCPPPAVEDACMHII